MSNYDSTNCMHETVKEGGERKKIVIIGAGPTAIGALYRIQQLQANGLATDEVDVCVIEQEDEPGGLARSVVDDTGFTWDLGVHVTGASKYAEFLQLMYDVIPDWNIVRRVVKADMTHVMQFADEETNVLDEEKLLEEELEPCSSSSFSSTFDTRSHDALLYNYVPYPVQSSIPYFPDALKQKCLRDLEDSNGFVQEHKPLNDENFGQFSEKIFGPTFQSIFIRPYNEKGVDGSTRRDELRSALCRAQLTREDDAQPSFFRYPAGVRGVGEMWRKIVAEKFDANIFHFRRKLKRVDYRNRTLFVDVLGSDGAEECFHYDTLISTIPITDLGRLTGLAPHILLRFSKVVLVGVGLRLPHTPLAKQLSWAYYPRQEIIFYRCTVLSNFSAALVPDAQRYWSVLCEIGVNSNKNIHEDEEEILYRTVNDLVTVGMISGPKQVYSKWMKVLDHGYPVPTLNREVTLKQVHAALESQNIFSRGRFGGWRYEISNQDHSFECGLQLVDRILLGIPETLYST